MPCSRLETMGPIAAASPTVEGSTPASASMKPTTVPMRPSSTSMLAVCLMPPSLVASLRRSAEASVARPWPSSPRIEFEEGRGPGAGRRRAVLEPVQLAAELEDAARALDEAEDEHRRDQLHDMERVGAQDRIDPALRRGGEHERCRGEVEKREAKQKQRAMRPVESRGGAGGQEPGEEAAERRLRTEHRIDGGQDCRSHSRTPPWRRASAGGADDRRAIVKSRWLASVTEPSERPACEPVLRRSRFPRNDRRTRPMGATLARLGTARQP